MKVLLVNGSPHERGCTHRALTEIEKTLREEGVESEILWLGRKPMGGCIACGGCRHDGQCVYDDLLNVSREKFRAADGFVFGTPVHYAAASGNLTAFMDRLFYSESKQTFFMKPFALKHRFNKRFGIGARDKTIFVHLEDVTKKLPFTEYILKRIPLKSAQYRRIKRFRRIELISVRQKTDSVGITETAKKKRRLIFGVLYPDTRQCVRKRLI